MHPEPAGDGRHGGQGSTPEGKIWRLLIYVVYPLLAGLLLLAALS
jgi:hypothetical protein